MEKALLIFLGGGLGSVMRYVLSHCIPHSSVESFPWATFFANILATAILAIVLAIGWSVSHQSKYYYFLAIGLCGGFSTFSTFSKEAAMMIEHGHVFHAIAYIMASTIICIIVFMLLYKNLSIQGE